MVTFEITNSKLFNEKVVDVDTTGLKNNGTDSKNNHLGFYGVLEIELEENNDRLVINGEFGQNDYENEYGFILIYK